jgi:hypothetical protein
LDFSRLSEDELESLSDFISYLPPEKVEKINTILSNINEDEVADKYNSEELNVNQCTLGAGMMTIPGISHLTREIYCETL